MFTHLKSHPIYLKVLKGMDALIFKITTVLYVKDVCILDKVSINFRQSKSKPVSLKKLSE